MTTTKSKANNEFVDDEQRELRDFEQIDDLRQQQQES